MYEKVIKIIQHGIRILLILIGVFMLAVSIGRFLGLDAYIVESGSMEPTIPTGSIVIADLKPRQTTVNQIVVFYIGDGNEQMLVTHRIVRRSESGNWITKGDGNQNEDLIELQEDQIKGTVVFHMPYVGYMAWNLQQHHLGTTFIITIIIVWVCSIALDKLYQKDKEEKEYESEV